MFKSRIRFMTTASLCVVAVALLVFVSVSSASTKAVNKQLAKSAKDFGGMAGLIKAAKKEGKLNVIALPDNWADYGQIMKQFSKQYGIKITSQNPNGNSQDEVNAVNQLAGTSRQPDVVDLGANVMLNNQALFAPYKVVNWAHIPANLKQKAGIWYADYTGYESIGYDANVVKPAPTTMKDLLKSAYKGMVALNGDPTTASAAFNGVVMAALANGGSADNIQPGIDYFKQLKHDGNLLPVDPTPATIASGQTPIVIDWDYNQLGAKQSLPSGSSINWKWVVPANDVVSSYYEQAIVKGCPHPAAARLWQEYLYSTAMNAGQNWWLRGGAHPVFQGWMTQTGTIDKKALAAAPKVTGTPVQLSQAQLVAGQALVKAQWPNL
jgi:putative spermidine/putrescine transport system substrate-binding protein